MASYTLRRKKRTQNPTRRLLTAEEVKELFVRIGKSGLTFRQIGAQLGCGHHAVSSWLSREVTVDLMTIERLKTIVLK